MSSASPAFAAAQAYFDALKKYDFNALKEALTPDAVLKIYPEHLKSPGGSNREEILQLMTVALKLVKDAKVRSTIGTVLGNTHRPDAYISAGVAGNVRRGPQSMGTGELCAITLTRRRGLITKSR